MKRAGLLGRLGAAGGPPGAAAAPGAPRPWAAPARPLKPEDYRIQSMPDVSPPWWNLGHTTWFFAKNVPEPHGLYRPEDARLEYVLNSYYEILGPRVDRAERGLQTRPTTEEIYAFRQRTDERLERLLAEVSDDKWEETEFLVATGIQH